MKTFSEFSLEISSLFEGEKPWSSSNPNLRKNALEYEPPTTIRGQQLRRAYDMWDKKPRKTEREKGYERIKLGKKLKTVGR